jgi:hypothetical protein
LPGPSSTGWMRGRKSEIRETRSRLGRAAVLGDADADAGGADVAGAAELAAGGAELADGDALPQAVATNATAARSAGKRARIRTSSTHGLTARGSPGIL